MVCGLVCLQERISEVHMLKRIGLHAQGMITNERGEPAVTLFCFMSVGGKFLWVGI